MAKHVLTLYNSLSRTEEPFKPLKKGKVSLYSCGPTVYNQAHLGNLRTYLFNDVLKRSLQYLGYTVTQVMNMTDVDDKTIKASQAQGIPLRALTRKYEDLFLADLTALNILHPTHITRATEYIPEMITLIETLIKKKYAYKAQDGIYFSIAKSKNYGKLANLDKQKKSQERIKGDEYDKQHAHDFALWKFHMPEDGDVVWPAAFGPGRPGWHIECSAMSMKLLGTSFDIHTGAIDLLFPHHTNEIAQSEAATGKKFVHYWLHGGFLTMKEGKMSKSLGNIHTLPELITQGYLPAHYRYLCLQTHYRSSLQFSFENLEAAKQAYERVKRKIIELKATTHKGADKTKDYQTQFTSTLQNDINIPAALQVFLKTLDDISFNSQKRLALLEHFDEVLGLEVKNMKEEKVTVPKAVQALVQAREEARATKQWAEADILRTRIKEAGFILTDTSQGPKVEKI
ncbi:cysteine--tRNA ligase [Candidatus Pacearchaeota archaeon]|nr:cysteine--tRNA ligase [Candidatus Pacearchaeota archaeon]